MAYPDYAKPFIVHTDASSKGLGCVLYQRPEDKFRVIAYGSRTLDKAEKIPCNEIGVSGSEMSREVPRLPELFGLL